MVIGAIVLHMVDVKGGGDLTIMLLGIKNTGLLFLHMVVGYMDHLLVADIIFL